MNGMWVSFTRCCKHLPASTWQFINPLPLLPPSYTTLPLSPLLSLLQPSFSFNATLPLCHEFYPSNVRWNISNSAWWSSNKRKQDICSRGTDSDKRRGWGTGCQVKNAWAMVRQRVRRWWRKTCLLCITVFVMYMSGNSSESSHTVFHINTVLAMLVMLDKINKTYHLRSPNKQKCIFMEQVSMLRSFLTTKALALDLLVISVLTFCFPLLQTTTSLIQWPQWII